MEVSHTDPLLSVTYLTLQREVNAAAILRIVWLPVVSKWPGLLN